MGSFAKPCRRQSNQYRGWRRPVLGLKTGLLTRVGADHMGRFIREQLLREGLDVSSVRTDEARPTALVVLGIRNRETFPLIFYRENCADMALARSDVDERSGSNT